MHFQFLEVSLSVHNEQHQPQGYCFQQNAPFLLFNQSIDQNERKMRKANSYRCHHQSLSLKPLSGRQFHTHTHAQAVFSTGQDLEQDRGQCNYCQLIRHIFSVPIGQTVRRADSCLCSLALFLSFAPFTASVQTVMLLLLFLLFFVFLKETNEKKKKNGASRRLALACEWQHQPGQAQQHWACQADAADRNLRQINHQSIGKQKERGKVEDKKLPTGRVKTDKWKSDRTKTHTHLDLETETPIAGQQSVHCEHTHTISQTFRQKHRHW